MATATTGTGIHAPVQPSEELGAIVGNEKLRIECGAADVRDRVKLVRDVLRTLGTPKLLEAA